VTTPERWQRVSQLYHSALLRDARERPAFLAEACADDDALRRDVESLLTQSASAVGFLDRPAVVVATEMQTMSDVTASVLTGRRIGVYQVEARIDAGGM